MMMLRKISVTRYVTPLREGGSLPGLMEADDEGLYVIKFRGAGQGVLPLVAEIICGELARSLGFPVPEIVLAEVDPDLAAAEADPEIQDLIAGSAGLNIGIDFLPGAFPFAPPIDADFAADIVWFDSLITNVDRTPRNPNLLSWHGQTWLIDHGAALIAQHGDDFSDAAKRPFPMIRNHVLKEYSSSIVAAHARLAPRLSTNVIEKCIQIVPVEWFVKHPGPAYLDFLIRRLEHGEFAREAEGERV